MVVPKGLLLVIVDSGPRDPNATRRRGTTGARLVMVMSASPDPNVPRSQEPTVTVRRTVGLGQPDPCPDRRRGLILCLAVSSE